MLIKQFLPYGLSAIALIGSGAAWKEAGRSCVLGVMGTEASVTVSGWHAITVCQGVVQREPNTYYLRETPPVESVICEFNGNGRHYVVRDRGLVMIVGRSRCAALAPSDQ